MRTLFAVGHIKPKPAVLSEEAPRLYRAGFSVRQIAERLGETWRAVRRAITDAGVEMRGQTVSRRSASVCSRGYAKWGNTRVHRIVCEAWHGPPPTPEHRVNHIDGDKLNNHPENLEWVTQRENRKHAFENGLLGSTLSAEQVRAVRFLRDRGVKLTTISEALGGYNTGNVSRVARRVYFDYVADGPVSARVCGWCSQAMSELDDLLAANGAPKTHCMCESCEGGPGRAA